MFAFLGVVVDGNDIRCREMHQLSKTSRHDLVGVIEKEFSETGAEIELSSSFSRFRFRKPGKSPGDPINFNGRHCLCQALLGNERLIVLLKNSEMTFFPVSNSMTHFRFFLCFLSSTGKTSIDLKSERKSKGRKKLLFDFVTFFST